MNNTNHFKDAENQLAQVVAGSVIPVPARYDVINVLVSLNSVVFAAWFDEFFGSIEYALASHGGALPGFSSNELKRYLETILYNRVQYSRNMPTQLRSNGTFLVPSFFAVVIAQVGRAVDSTLGVELLPQMEMENPMTEDEVYSFSMKLRVLERFGFCFTIGYARDRSGDFPTMSFFCTEENVMGSDKASPECKSVIAGFLGITGIEQVLSPRIRYGSMGHFALLVRQLARPRIEL